MARKKGPHTDIAFEYIKEKILSCELLPGIPISDNNLALELGMSRAPVREAMLLLQAQGLLESAENKTVVSSITLTDIIEICQVRQAVETQAVKIALGNGALPLPLQERLSEIFDAMLHTAEGSRYAHYERDDQFHALLVESSGNNRLMQIAQQMRLQMHRARWLNIVLPNRRSAAMAEHQAILDALLSGHCANAVAAVEEHLANSANNFSALLSGSQMNMILSSIRGAYHL